MFDLLLAQLPVNYIARMDQYDGLESKVALALTSSQVAKNNLVQEFGIGEDIPFTFFFWGDGSLQVVVQMVREKMLLSVPDRLNFCTEMMRSICSVMDIDAISFVAEGFETLDKKSAAEKELKQVFMEGDSSVRECLVVTHCEVNKVSDKIEMILVSLPYEYRLGREINWDAPISFVNSMNKVLKTSSISNMLTDAIRVQWNSDASDDEFDATFDSVVANGFQIYAF